VAKRQQARETVVPADAQRARLRIGEPTLGNHIVEKSVQAARAIDRIGLQR